MDPMALVSLRPAMFPNVKSLGGPSRATNALEAATTFWIPLGEVTAGPPHPAYRVYLAQENPWLRLQGRRSYFISIMMTWVGVSPTFMPMWVCASDHITSPALNSRINSFPSGSTSFRLNGETA